MCHRGRCRGDGSTDTKNERTICLMKGRIEIRVSNNRARFRFTLERNITVVRGDSGTGKMTL